MVTKSSHATDPLTVCNHHHLLHLPGTIRFFNVAKAPPSVKNARDGRWEGIVSDSSQRPSDNGRPDHLKIIFGREGGGGKGGGGRGFDGRYTQRPVV